MIDRSVLDCESALSAALNGDLERWWGLPPCTENEAEGVLGPSVASHGLLGACRRSTPPGAGADGVQAVYRGGKLSALLFRPNWHAEALRALGSPEDESRSDVGFEYVQRTWAARGLIAHVAVAGEAVVLVALFAPAPLEALKASDIFYLGVRERLEGPPR